MTYVVTVDAALAESLSVTMSEELAREIEEAGESFFSGYIEDTRARLSDIEERWGLRIPYPTTDDEVFDLLTRIAFNRLYDHLLDRP